MAIDFRNTEYSREWAFNRDQETIINSDLTKNHVIIGGPGTGKSIMAINMAERIDSN